MEKFNVILIAVSLSLDAFSLALAYGLLGINKKTILMSSIIVGVFHFLMPFLGYTIGNVILKYVPIKPNFIVSFIFLLLVIEMIKSLKEEVQSINLNFLNSLLFGLTVSLDSFTIGIGLKIITNNILFAYITFSIFSFIFTLTGFLIGKKLSLKVSKYSKIIGIILLFILFIYYLLL